MSGPAPDLATLVAGVELLSLDAGNTIIFLDHARVARLLGGLGFPTDAPTLVRTEGEAKRLQVTDALVDVPWDDAGAPGGRGWGRMVGTIAARAGVPIAGLPRVLEALWKEHVRLNFWSQVPDNLGPALDRARAAGIRAVVVSNSEGMLDGLFAELGIAQHFDAIVDSGKVGVEKPDPRIFELALAPYGVPPEAALHLGDSVATDVLGAEAAGLRAALIDPHGHWEGAYANVARVRDVAEVAAALLDRR